MVSKRGSSLDGIMAESYSGPMIKLTSTNYSLWKSMIEDLLNYKKKTLGVIRQWVNISLYNHVAKETDPHTLWKNKENMYETKNA